MKTQANRYYACMRRYVRIERTVGVSIASVELATKILRA